MTPRLTARILVGAVACLVTVAFTDIDDEVPGCGYCYNNSDATAHAISSTRIFWYNHMHIDCIAFNSCHADSQPGRCSEYHWICGGGGGVDAGIVQSVEGMLARNDAAGLRRLLASHPRNFRHGVEGETIELVDCKGKLVRRFTAPAALRGSLSLT